MTEATKRPWSRGKSGHLTANPESNDPDDILHVVHGVNVPSGEHHPRYAEALANQELIIKAVNSHDALVAEATELLKNTTWDEDSVGYARVLTQDIEALKAALEQVK